MLLVPRFTHITLGHFITYRIAPNFRGSKFREIAENPIIENFCDKNFVIATFFRDYRRTAAPMRTIHIVAPPTIARGSELG